MYIVSQLKILQLKPLSNIIEEIFEANEFPDFHNYLEKKMNIYM